MLTGKLFKTKHGNHFYKIYDNNYKFGLNKNSFNCLKFESLESLCYNLNDESPKNFCLYEVYIPDCANIITENNEFKTNLIIIDEFISFKSIINNFNDDVKLKLIRKNGFLLRYIDKPSDYIKLEAIRQNGNCIQYVEYPNDYMKTEAVRQTSSALNFISNPSDLMKMVAAAI